MLFNNNEECGVSLFNYLVKTGIESADPNILSDIIHDINNLRGYEWLENIERSLDTKKFFDYIGYPEFDYDNFIHNETVSPNLLLKVMFDVDLNGSITFDEFREILDSNGYKHLWDYDILDLDEAVSNNEFLIAISFYKENGHYVRILECNEEIDEKFNSVDNIRELNFSLLENDKEKSLDELIAAAKRESKSVPDDGFHGPGGHDTPEGPVDR